MTRLKSGRLDNPRSKKDKLRLPASGKDESKAHRLQGVHPRVHFHKHVSAPATVPTGRPSVGHKLLTPKGDAPVPAVASFHIDLQGVGAEGQVEFESLL